MSEIFPPRLSTRQAADPPYRKVGKRVLYDRDELLAWLDSKRRASTSDPGPTPAAKAA